MTVIVDVLPIFAFVAPTLDARTCAVATTETFAETVCVPPEVNVEPLTVCVDIA